MHTVVILLNCSNFIFIKIYLPIQPCLFNHVYGIRIHDNIMKESRNIQSFSAIKYRVGIELRKF